MNFNHLLIAILAITVGLAFGLMLKSASVAAAMEPTITTVQLQDNVRCYVLAGTSNLNPGTMDCVQLWMPEELQQQ